MEAEPPFAAEPQKRRRRWFQFSLRTLMIVTTVVAVGCGWLGSKIERKWRERAAVNKVIEAGGSVSYDYQVKLEPLSVKPVPDAVAPGPAWLRWMLGDDFFARPIVAFTGDLQGPDALCLTDLPELEMVAAQKPESIRAVLPNLSELPKLKYLCLVNVVVTDEDVEHLKRLTRLEILAVLGYYASDAARNELTKALPNCQMSEGTP